MKKDAGDHLERSHQLSRLAVADAVSPQDIELLLGNIGARHVLISGHMLSFYTGNPRTTIDVGFIVSPAHVKRAVDTISKAYPQFDQRNLVYNVRFSSRADGRTDNADPLCLYDSGRH